MKKRFQATRRILRIAWTEHVNNREVLEKMETHKTFILRIRKKHLEFTGHIVSIKVFGEFETLSTD